LAAGFEDFGVLLLFDLDEFAEALAAGFLPLAVFASGFAALETPSSGLGDGLPPFFLPELPPLLDFATRYASYRAPRPVRTTRTVSTTI
jgi:hypothetical protein